jgi:hypothetical protein
VTLDPNGWTDIHIFFFHDIATTLPLANRNSLTDNVSAVEKVIIGSVVVIAAVVALCSHHSRRRHSRRHHLCLGWEW